MSENEPGVPSDGKGGVIVAVCFLMMILSAIGAVIGAYQFTKVASYTSLQHDPVLVVFWLAGGAGSVAFWYVLSGLGTIIQWLEHNQREASQAPGTAVETEGSGTAQPKIAPSEPAQPTTPQKGYIRRGRRSV